MNLQLPESTVRTVCRELIDRHGQISGRALCVELKRRFGAVGKTSRIFALWRAESAAAAARSRLRRVGQEEILARLEAAERQAAEYLARAKLAEEREESHQSHWALEIDRLREQLRHQPNYAADNRRLQTQVLELTAELAVLRSALKREAERDSP
jgi:hypothetical protein